MSFVTKAEVTEYLKSSRHNDIRELVENSRSYVQTSECAGEPVFYEVKWNGSSEEFSKVASQLSQTECLMQSPELGWATAIINHCFVFYKEYNIGVVDSVILTINGMHYLRIVNTNQAGSGRSLAIHYTGLRDNIAAMRSDARLNRIERWTRGGVISMVLMILMYSSRFEIRNVGRLF